MSAYNVTLTTDLVLASTSFVTVPFNNLVVASSDEWNTGTYTLTPNIGLASTTQYAIMGVITFEAGANWLTGETYGMQAVAGGTPYEVIKTQASDNTDECSVTINTVLNLAYGETLYITVMHDSAASHTIPELSNKASICVIG